MKIHDLYESKFEEQFPHLRLYAGTPMPNGEYKWRFRTKPRDTFLPIHNTISKQSVEKFGINVRALLFCTFDYDMAKKYTTTDIVTDGSKSVMKVIVPNGQDFRLFQSKVYGDMTIALDISVDIVRDAILQLLKRVGLGPVYYSFEKKVIELFKTKYQNDYTGDYSDFIQDIKNDIHKHVHEISDVLKDRGVEFKEEIFNTRLGGIYNKFYREAGKYIDTVYEITGNEDIQYNRLHEVMVYAPDGFVVKDIPNT